MSTAIATTKPPLPAEAQRLVDERQTRNLVAAKIAGMSWGKDLDIVARRALADWGQQHGVDVATEIHILGGRIYKSADFFLNRAQPYVRAGKLAYSYRYINVDKRLDDLARQGNADAQKELDERAMLRIQFNAPEAAHSTVLFITRIPQSGESFAAVKFCGGGTRKGDPVGDSNPESTALTRAARKSLRMVVGYEPELAIAFGEGDAEDDVVDIEEVIQRSQSEQRATNAEILAGARQGLRNVVNVPELTTGFAELGTIHVDTSKAADLFPDDLTDAEVAARDAENDAINQGH